MSGKSGHFPRESWQISAMQLLKAVGMDGKIDGAQRLRRGLQARPARFVSVFARFEAQSRASPRIEEERFSHARSSHG